MITHDIGRSNWFWGVDKAYSVPFRFTTTVHENEHPFRSATATGIRVSPSKAVLFGKWGKAASNPTEHLLEALRGRDIGSTDIPQLA